jgi:hypothetical protein
MADLTTLQAQRAQLITEIQKRGGRGKAPNYEKRLAEVEAQIRSMKDPAAQAANPAAAPPPTIPEIKTPQDALNADVKVADYSAEKNLILGNPNQVNPYGTREVTTGPDGKPVVTDTLAADQKKLSDTGTTLSQTGLDKAMGLLGSDGVSQPFNPNLTARTATGDLIADRKRMEDTVFNNITRNFQHDYARNKDDLEQSLANRGIPIDPLDPQYKEAMKQLNERTDAAKADAMAQATQMGGEELTRSVGIGEQLRANDFSQQYQTHGQQMGDVQSLSTLGPGVRTPNFNPYQAPTWQVTSPTAAATAVAGIQQGQQQVDNQGRQINAGIANDNKRASIAQQAANRIGSQGQTTGGAATPPPFM